MQFEGCLSSSVLRLRFCNLMYRYVRQSSESVPENAYTNPHLASHIK